MLTARRRPASLRDGWLLLTLLCAAEFVTILDFSIATVALPAIDEDLGFSEAALPWVLNAYGIAIAGLLMLGGRLADLFGRREVFAVGMGVFTAASFVGGLAESPALLIAMRAGQGIGAALVTPAALSIVTTTFTDQRVRNRALGVWGAVGATGLAAGLVLGAVITEVLGWRWVLWVNVPIGIVALTLIWFVLPRIVVRRRERLDVAGATLAVSGLVAFVYGVGRLEETGLGSSLTVGLLAGGLALMAAFAFVECRVVAPLAPPRLLRNRSVASANLVSLMANAGFAAAFVVLSLHLQLVLDIGTLATGLVLVPMAASVAVVAGALSPRLLPIVGARRLVVAGMSLAAVGLVGLGLSIDDGLPWMAVLPGSLAAGAGYGLAFPAWTVVGVERVEDERQGFASGLLTTTQEVGASVGFAIVVTIAAAVAGDGAAVTADSTADGFRWGVLLTGAMSAAGALFALLTPRRDADVALSGPLPEPARA